MLVIRRAKLHYYSNTNGLCKMFFSITGLKAVESIGEA